MSDSDQAQGSFTTDVSYLRQFLDSLDSVRDEGKVIITDDKVFSKVVDPANVMMAVSRIRGRGLNAIGVDGGDEVVIGARFERLYKVLKGVSGTSEVEFTYPVVDGGTNMIDLEIIDEDVNFKIPGLDKDSVPKMPASDPISHKTRIIVPGTDFKKNINNANKVVSEDEGSVIFKTYGGVFEMLAKDKVDGSFSKKFRQSGPTEGEELDEHETEIGYRYLDDLTKPVGNADEVEVHIANEQPLRLDVSIDDEGDAEAIYIIAPRLDDQG